jgi:hypothetical protein
MYGIALSKHMSSLYIEYRLAETARESAYDEMLTRRGDYLELYASAGMVVDVDDELDAIDQTDWEFWQFHNAVNQRYSNAAEAFGRAVAMGEQEVLRTFGGNNPDLVTIDWDAHQNDGLHQPERWPSKAQD